VESYRETDSGAGEAAEELRRALESCALVDRSELGRLLATGPDLLDLLHRLSTADIHELAAGHGKPTVLTTSKGRIVERLFVNHLGPAGVLMTGGPGCAQKVIDHLARYTFAEQTGIHEITEETRQFAVVGPRAASALPDAFGRPERFGSVTVDRGAATLHVLGHDGMTGDGLSVVVARQQAGAVREELAAAVAAAGGMPAGSRAFEAYRVLRGLPASDYELGEEHNPLEAGLGEAVSFDKGCYVGQEVVARLNTYDKVARRIVGLTFKDGAPVPELGASLYHEGREVGKVSSALVPPGWSRPVALAYVKRNVGPGSDLAVGAADATLHAAVIDPPFDQE